ncbi:MAG TPA: barstar family protein, partial [Thermoanaerobaculia bacterium]|jgi:hypothetical protein|nr:barstar family protein [Thermoanaerobaculia bacterium]
VITEEERKWLPSYLYKAEGSLPVIRVLRGEKMHTLQGLMDEVGAALQFFDGFGENWNALDECLSYLDEWLPADAYILVITKPQELLAQESEDERLWFLKIVNKVAEWWSRPIVDNDRFKRDAIPFHLILRCDERELGEVILRFPRRFHRRWRDDQPRLSRSVSSVSLNSDSAL